MVTAASVISFRTFRGVHLNNRFKTNQTGAMYLIILTFVLLVYLIWRLGTRNFGYWKKKGVRHDKPMFFFGNMYNNFMLKLSIAQQVAEWHDRFSEEKYVGVHMANDLGLVLRDPELIRRVLITDSQYFHQRGFNSHKHVREPMYQNLFTVDGDIWKLVRQRVTPAFSSAKLKAMFPLIQLTAEKMLSVIKPGTQDVRDLMARYTTDFIGVCGFGLNIDSLHDQSSMFRCLGKRIFQYSTRDAMVRFLKRFAPDLFKNLHYFVPEIEKNTVTIVKQILKQRNYVPSGRNDFIDLLLEVRQKGKMIGESIEKFNPDGSPKTVEMELDDILLAAQVLVFFAAGFETSSALSSFFLHEIAFNPDVQERCHKEIDQVLSRHDGRITYDAIKEMRYLEMVLKETLRLHPSPGYLLRRCAKKYTFPGTDLTIDEDVYVLIALEPLHKNPVIFEDPECFNPERFNAENVDSAHKYHYLPFGAGPRACIGERLGIMQSLAGVTALLSRFSVQPAPTTRRHPIIDPRSYVVENVVGGLPLTLVRRRPAH